MGEEKIMLVEDDALLAMELVEVLKTSAYKVSCVANSGEKALQEIKREPPDIIIMDIRLKGKMDGIQTAVIVKEVYDIPVIFLTANGDDHFIKRAKIAEPYGFLMKPYEYRELHATIEVALYKFKLEVERKELVEKLQSTVRKIKVLESTIPICSVCKKIRDDHGSWKPFIEYFSKSTNVHFTHGMCPICAGELYPEFYGKGT